MDNGKIWVVIRSQGEWSDRGETCVCWFPGKVAAESFIERATGESRDAAQRWRALEDKHEGGVSDTEYEHFIGGLTLLDKTFDPASYDADSVTYFMHEVSRGEL